MSEDELISSVIETLENESVPSLWKQISTLADIIRAEITRLDERITVLENEVSLFVRDESHPSGKISVLEKQVKELQRTFTSVTTSINNLTAVLKSYGTTLEYLQQKLEELNAISETISDLREFKGISLSNTVREISTRLDRLTERVERIEKRRMRLIRRRVYRISENEKKEADKHGQSNT
jgi:chromosome segregation ATPase